MNRPAPLCGVSCKLTRRPCKTVQSTHPRGVRHLFEHGHQLRQIISTHAPREGCDRSNSSVFSWRASFQSTHPARGATPGRREGNKSELIFQSTHPARGATPHVGQRPVQQAISIHAPREGCDRLYLMALFGTYNNFNPRTPRGVRRPRRMVQNRHGAISIHAPREGCDVQIGRRAQDDAKHFNPRTPRGVRPLIMDAFIANANFNPRTPRGVRRTTGVYLGIPQRFQSTHPARGATIGIPAGHNPLLYFNPRTPRGVRRFGCHITPLFYQFQSTHPARGATFYCDICQKRHANFNPRTPRGVRRQEIASSSHIRTDFNPRTPRGVRLLWW